MKKGFKDRYGIPGNEIGNLATRYYKFLACDWDCLDDFLFWASQNGYQKGLKLRKKNEKKNHGPDNSYFEDSQLMIRRRKERFQEYTQTQSEFCSECHLKKCPSGGCYAWQEYFIKHWNKCIHHEKPKPVVVDTAKVWRYEHPDLVREGICFISEI